MNQTSSTKSLFTANLGNSSTKKMAAANIRRYGNMLSMMEYRAGRDNRWVS